MITILEKWLENQNLQQDSSMLFKEANLCYKSSAYKAAMLFSYLAFQTILKNRILSATVPIGYTKTLWSKIQKDIRNDDKWDTTVFECSQRKKPSPIFIISEDLRQQLIYWRNRRNDAAHSKSNIVNYALVESFWCFIESNLPKLVVAGSKESLTNKIKRHFDYRFNPPGKNYDYIIQEIPHAIEKHALYDFFEEIGNSTDVFSNNEDRINFFVDILKIENPNIINKLCSYLKTNESLLFQMISKTPNILNYYKKDSEFLRYIWYSKLEEYPFKNTQIFTYMLKNKLIPKKDINEAFEIFINNRHKEHPTEDDLQVLIKFEFYNAFKKTAFEDNAISQFYWANDNREFIIHYLNNFKLDKIIIQSISNTFCNSKHPWHLKDSLNDFFNENSAKRERFIKIANDNDIALPKYYITMLGT